MVWASTSSATSTGKSHLPFSYSSGICTNQRNSEEQQPLEDFFKAKGIRIKNEMSEESATLLKAALDNDDMMESSDEEGARADRGSADEDEESVDEDFNASSDSDVAEEYDSAHESSGDSDEEMGDAGGDDDGEAAAGSDDDETRPKKKSKIGK